MIDLASFIAIYGLSMNVVALSTKMIYAKIKNEREVKDLVLEQGLYHVTSDENIEKIKECGYFKPSSVLLSLGKRKTFFFAGRPDYDTLMQNVASVNTYEFSALKLKLTEEQLASYRVRKYSDNAVVCNGKCMLQDKQVEKVSLVLDIDEKGNIFSREKEEGENYVPKQELIDKINLKPTKMQEIKNLGIQQLKYYKKLPSIIKEMNSDLLKHIKDMFARVTQVKIEENADIKIDRLLNEFSFDKKNPYRDERFGDAVAEFQTQGLTQLDFKTELKALTQSEDGKFFRDRVESIDKTPIRKYGIHGIKHNNRVAMHAMLIAKREGLLEHDSNNKIKDILLMAAYLHDIGRMGDVGLHAKRSATMIEDLNIKFADGEEYAREDKNLLKFLVEGHEGKDKKSQKLMEKYEISSEKAQLAQEMLNVIKDADALDRVRIDTNLPFYMKTNLNPNYLRTDTSKRLLNVSYELESLHKNVNFSNLLSYKTNSQTEEIKDKMQMMKESFENGLKVEISKLPQIPQKVKKTLHLNKEKMICVGKNVRDKIDRMVKCKVKQKQDDSFER